MIFYFPLFLFIENKFKELFFFIQNIQILISMNYNLYIYKIIFNKIDKIKLIN